MADVSSQEDLIPRSRTRRRRALDAATARLFKMPRGRHDYTLTEAVPVPMRDGVELLTDVYAPVEKSRGTILVRTPYGRTGVIAAITARYYASHGYHVVNQSCRGTYGSGGDFEPFRREIDDGPDTVAWLRQQPWFGGRFALVGASYLGFTAWAIMTDPPPELACAVIAVSAHDNHGVTHGHGVFSLEPTLSLCDGFAHLEDGTLKGVLRLVTADRRLKPAFEELPLVRAQETVLAGSTMPYRDWLTAPERRGSGVAADAAGPGARADQRPRPAAGRLAGPVRRPDDRTVRAAAAPWGGRRPDHRPVDPRRGGHQGLRESSTRRPSTGWPSTSPGPVGASDRPRSGCSWSAPTSGVYLPEWPPRISASGCSSCTPTVSWRTPSPAPTTSPSTFTYDPADPRPPWVAGSSTPRWAGYRDNRRLEQRDDVLTFTTPPLVEPLEVIGNPVVELVHHTDNPYADLFVRLCEVEKNGKSVNISDAISPARAGDVQRNHSAAARRHRPSVPCGKPHPAAGLRRRASAVRPEPGHGRGSGDERQDGAIAADDRPRRRRFLAGPAAVSALSVLSPASRCPGSRRRNPVGGCS